MPRHSREQTEITRTRILDAAGAIFSSGGYDGTTLDAIARRAETSKSLIVHHFGSKEQLWDR